MINKNDLRKAISSIAISNAKRNTIYKAFSDLGSITKEEFDSVKSDISKVVESMLTKDTVGKANGVASLDSNGNVPIEQLGNIDTTLFLIVRELPTTDIKTNKIYLVPNQDGQGNNVYIEYLYVEDVWEKLGEFKPEVDLSECVKFDEIYQCIKKEYDSSKRGDDSIAIDDSAVASGNISIAFGCEAQAIGDNAIALGYNTQVTAVQSIALGGSAQATSGYSIALGSFANTTSEYCVALGYGAQANANKALALGNNTASTNNFSTAIGSGAKASGSYSTAIGCDAVAVGDQNIAIGCDAKSTRPYSIVIGKNVRNSKSIFTVASNGTNYIDMVIDNYGLYLKGFGNYNGTNLVVKNDSTETLNPDIKSVQQIINEKADASAIPTKLSQLTNDANFITSYIETDPVWTREKTNYYTKTEIDNKGYLTAHQSLDAYAKKIEIPNVSTKADLVGGKLKTDQLPKLVNITTASTLEEVLTKFNALLDDLKDKGYMEANTAE